MCDVFELETVKTGQSYISDIYTHQRDYHYKFS